MLKTFPWYILRRHVDCWIAYQTVLKNGPNSVLRIQCVLNYRITKQWQIMWGHVMWNTKMFHKNVLEYYLSDFYISLISFIFYAQHKLRQTLPAGPYDAPHFGPSLLYICYFKQLQWTSCHTPSSVQLIEVLVSFQTFSGPSHMFRLDHRGPHS